jgi:hypothetical protein
MQELESNFPAKEDVMPPGIKEVMLPGIEDDMIPGDV